MGIWERILKKKKNSNTYENSSNRLSLTREWILADTGHSRQKLVFVFVFVFVFFVCLGLLLDSNDNWDELVIKERVERDKSLRVKDGLYFYLLYLLWSLPRTDVPDDWLEITIINRPLEEIRNQQTHPPAN